MFVPTDLHGHTLFSDGRATPEQYIDFRREIGMRAVAIADHDVLRAVPRGAAAAAAAQMVFIPAVEVTSFIHFGTPDAEQIHILAYYPEAFLRGPRLASTALHRRGLRVEARWRDFVLEWVSSLAEADRLALSAEGPLEALPPGEFPALQSFI
ncbi:MAG: PHP domain-containing protein, partial [Polyangiaceae bacterium]|nr:PHP domain-containing protein [Polyangiaceae bacterium]